MSLFGALSLGGSSLAAQQVGLQVTGNNIANAGTAGYTRQTVELTPGSSTQVAPGQYLGNGVTVASIQRQADEAVNSNLRDATSDQSAADTLNSLLTQLQSTFGTLNDGDLSAQMNDFFNDFSTLANNPSDTAQRSVVIQDGSSLASYLQNLRGQLSSIQSTSQQQAGVLVTQANSLAQSIAQLNGQIATSTTSAGTDNNLLDQRDQDLSQLAQIMNIQTVVQPDGAVNVLVGSMPLVQGTQSNGVSSKQVANGTTNSSTTQILFANSGDVMNVTGGQLGSLLGANANYLEPAVQTVDQVAAGLISAVNEVHTQGQGTTGFSSVTGTTDVLDPTAALNGPASTTGIAFPPGNGSFDLYITDATTGETTTQQVNVNLSGNGTPDSLNSLAANINAAGNGAVTASVNASGQLTIASNDPNVTFGFGNDSSGVLSALGINTFFTGNDASNIAVNNVLLSDPSKLAAGQDNEPGSNTNAQALSLVGNAAVSQLGGQSLNDYYTNYIGTLAAHAQNASDNATAQSTIYNSIYNQQQAISGVSMDEEAVNLTKYQRAFEGSAQFITVVNELMQTVLTMMGTA